jgi:hypothetical protein
MPSPTTTFHLLHEYFPAGFANLVIEPSSSILYAHTERILQIRKERKEEEKENKPL